MSKKGKGKKEKIPAEKPDETSSRTDFTIVFLNATDESVGPMLDAFFAQIQTRVRRAVVAVNFTDIQCAIVSDKDNPEMFAANEDLKNGKFPSTEIVLKIIRKKIGEFLAENDRILQVQETNRNFDVLQYWSANDDPKITYLNRNEKATKGAKAKAPKAPKPGKLGAKTKSQELIESKLVRVEAPIYLVKNWSSLAMRGQSSNNQIYIEDAPIEGPTLYVVCIGIYDCSVIDELLKINYPVMALIQLGPSVPHECADESISSFWSKWDEIRYTDPYKTVAFIEATSEILPTRKIQQNAEQLNTELCSLVYEAQDYRRYHQRYLDNFRIIKVDESNKFVMTDSYPEYQRNFGNIKPEHVTVEYMLDSMINQVDALCEDRKQNPSLASSNVSILPITVNDAPWLCHIEESWIIEYCDILMKRLYNGETFNRDIYNRTMDTMNMAYKLNDILNAIESCEKDQILHPVAAERLSETNFEQFEHQLNILFITKALAEKLEVKASDSKLSGYSSDSAEKQIVRTDLEQICDHLTESIESRCKKSATTEYYADKMTPEALRQQIVECYQTFEHNDFEYFPLTDVLIVRFWNDDVRFQTQCSQHVLPTYLCYRDFVQHVMSEQYDWIKSTEEEIRKEIENDALSKSADKAARIIESDFYRNRSLKKHENSEFEDDLKPPASVGRSAATPKPIPEEETPRENKLKGKKGKAAKKEIAIVEEASAVVSDVPEKEKRFFGYNLDDKRYQLNVRRSIYRTDITKILYQIQEWMYRDKNLNIEIDTYDHQIYVRTTFNNGGERIDDIKNVFILCPNGISVTMNIIDEPMEIDSDGVQADLPTTNRVQVGLSWPTGLQIHTGPSEINGMQAVEQSWVDKAPDNEIQRRFHANGIVEILMANGDEKILTSTGAMYEQINIADVDFTKTRNDDDDDEDPFNDGEQNPFNTHRDAIELLSMINPTLSEKPVKLTTTDGRQFIIEDGLILHEMTKLCTTDSYDYADGTNTVHRQDGLRLIYYPDNTVCLYTDGTKITTEMFTDRVRSDSTMNFEVESSTSIDKGETSMITILENTLEDSTLISSLSASLARSPSELIANELLDKFLVHSTVDRFENVRRTFAFQHPNYATVKFDECARTTVLSPDCKLVFSKSNCLANLGGSILLRTDPDRMLIEAMQCVEHGKQSQTRINFRKSHENILESSDGFECHFHIDCNGAEWFSDTFAKSLLWHRVDECKMCAGPRAAKQRLFVVKNGFEGYEYIEKSEAEHQIDQMKPLLLHRTGADIACLVPFTTLDNRFKMSLGNLDRFKEVLHNEPCCAPPKALKKKFLDKLCPILLQRYFQKIDPNCEAVLQLIDAIKMQSALPRKTKVNFASFNRELCQIAERTIANYLQEEVSTFEELNRPKTPPPPTNKLTERRDAIARDTFYRKIIRNRYIPKYYVFHEVDSHVKNLNCFCNEWCELESATDCDRPYEKYDELMEEEESDIEDIMINRQAATSVVEENVLDGFENTSNSRGVM